MTIGSWDPSLAAEGPLALDEALLTQLAGYSRDDQLEDLDERLPAAEQQRLAGLMQLEHDQWLAAGESLTEDQLLHLVRFFAVAENLPGWEAGARSPVIPLARILRQRGQRLDRELLQWLRSVNENRFLPYGPL